MPIKKKECVCVVKSGPVIHDGVLYKDGEEITVDAPELKELEKAKVAKEVK